MLQLMRSVGMHYQMSASQRLEFVTELGRHYDAGLQLGQSSCGKVEVEVVESSVIFFSLSVRFNGLFR